MFFFDTVYSTHFLVLIMHNLQISVVIIACMRSIQIVLILIFWFPADVLAENKMRPLLQDYSFGVNSSVLVTATDRKVLYAWQADKHLIPASTLKLLTANLAIKKWGAQHRFKTDFYWMNGWLWVQGYGDPFLVSEELDVLVKQLLAELPDNAPMIDGIGIDGSFFYDVSVPGRSGVNDPYNAPLSAVSVNFNTVFINKLGRKVTTAETQTPLTPTAQRLALPLGNGKHRINLHDSATAQQHFAELLMLKLKQQGAEVKPALRYGEVPIEAEHFYSHINSTSLDKVIQASLKYSNNFVANQLFTLLGGDGQSQALSLRSSQKWVEKKLLQSYAVEDPSWQGVVVEEGAGLSRNNRLSARQLTQVLYDFLPHQYLLKPYENGIVRAKTGTLNGVQTFAGYIDMAGDTFYFVFLFNDPVAYGYRKAVLQQLLKDLKSQ